MFPPHVIAVLGAAGGSAVLARFLARPICDLVLGIIALFRCEREDIPAVMQVFRPPGPV